MDILPAAASDTGPLNAPGVLSAAVAASAASTSKRPDPSSNRPDAASNSPEVASNHADGTGDRAADESPLAVPPEPATLLDTGFLAPSWNRWCSRSCCSAALAPAA